MSKKNYVAEVEGIDGVDHINLYSRAATELGRKGSHFAYASFEHPEYGKFDSMEGFWYWLRSKYKGTPEVERLRTLYGYSAKEHGRKQESEHFEDFHRTINTGNWYKFTQNDDLRQLMIDSHLRFDHYYVVGDGKIMVRPNGFEWLIAGFEAIRKQLKKSAYERTGDERYAPGYLPE